MGVTTAEARLPLATLELAELERKPLRMAATPGPSLFALAADVVGARRGVPDRWVAAARAQLEPADLAALAPIGARAGRYTPGCLTTDGDRPPEDGVQAAQQIASLPVETFLEDVLFAVGSSPPEPWDRIVRQPRRWLLRYAGAIGRVWKGIRGPWATASELLDREAHRIHAAAAHQALPELMRTVHHQAHVRDGRWQVPNAEHRALRLPDDGLRLTPLLAGPGAARIRYDDDGVLVSIAYPLPGVLRLLDGDPPRPGNELEALIGAPRAMILRVLDRPREIGQIGRDLGATPSTATYHVRALEAAGLLLRERAGRRVMAYRTSRGAALLDLYQRQRPTLR